MDASLNAASVAISISVGVSLLAGFFAMFVAVRSRNGTAGPRDLTVSIFFCIAGLLILLNVIAAARIAVWGMAYVGLLQVALLLTAVFAAAGVVCGLRRGQRSGRAIDTQSV